MDGSAWPAVSERPGWGRISPRRQLTHYWFQGRDGEKQPPVTTTGAHVVKPLPDIAIQIAMARTAVNQASLQQDEPSSKSARFWFAPRA